HELMGGRLDVGLELLGQAHRLDHRDLVQVGTLRDTVVPDVDVISSRLRNVAEASPDPLERKLVEIADPGLLAQDVDQLKLLVLVNPLVHQWKPHDAGRCFPTSKVNWTPMLSRWVLTWKLRPSIPGTGKSRPLTCWRRKLRESAFAIAPPSAEPAIVTPVVI